MAAKKTLSVALAVYNEEKNIQACLDSVRDIADEIVIVDGGSTDRTVELAHIYTNKIIQTTNPAVFHINKQKALDKCTGDWILQLDADEVVTDALSSEIQKAMTSSVYNGYYIPRKNFFWGAWMKKGGQYPDHVVRLFRRGKGHFPSKTVHEQIEVAGKVGYLTNPMDHHSYRSLSDYWRKADAYTTLTAMELKSKGTKKTIGSWVEYMILKPKITFFNLFIRHKGFLDGWRGFLFALFSAWHHPIAYRKFLHLATIVVLFLIVGVGSVRAEYVLPYPSFMPGHALYKFTRILDDAKRYWYFGPIAETKYHLLLSDKYLVEAKTLFEYKQYLLASDALIRSDQHFEKLSATPVTKEAAQKHSEVLNTILLSVPEEFTWTPEKSASTQLDLRSMVQSALTLRARIASQAAWQQ